MSADAAIDYLNHCPADRVEVWCEGFADWVDWRKVPELADHVRPAPSVVPVPSILPEPTKPLPIIDTDLVAEKRRVQQPHVRMKYRYIWAKGGLLLGALISGLDFLYLLASWSNTSVRPWDSVTDVAYYLGNVGAAIGTLGVLGFLTGGLLDLLIGRPEPIIEAASPPPRSNNFVARHWRGEYPLWVSYWIVNVAGSASYIIVLIFAAAILYSSDDDNPVPRFFAFVAVWLGVLPIATWQVVGLWRSATRYTVLRANLGKGSIWAGLAKLIVILGVLRMLAAGVTNVVPQSVDLWRMAFEDDPDVGEYSVRVMRDGTEAEVSGGIKYGLTNALAKALDASPQIHVIHLDSRGGRGGEGEKLFEFIRERQLDTYVSSVCVSACSMAFAGGRHRYLLSGATLGFHQGGRPGVNPIDRGDALQRRIFRSAGVSDAFINRALSTPFENVWTPSEDILLKSKIVTEVVDGSKFALSGLGSHVTKETIAEELVHFEGSFQIMERRFPEIFSSFVDEYYQSFLNGQTEHQAFHILLTHLEAYTRETVVLADDDVVSDYVSLLIEKLAVLEKKDSAGCYAEISGKSATGGGANALDDLREREQALRERVIRTAAVRRPPDPAALKPLGEKLVSMLQAQGIARTDLQIIKSGQTDKLNDSLVCSFTIAIYQTIGTLPLRERAMLLRDMLAK